MKNLRQIHRRATLKRWAVTLLAIGLAIPAAFAKHPKIARDLDITNRIGSVDVIVQFHTPPTGRHHQKMAHRGGRLKSELGAAKAGLYSIPVEALEDLANDPDVASIDPDREVAGALDVAVQAVNASIAQASNFTGAGIGVAVIVLTRERDALAPRSISGKMLALA